MAPAVKMRRVFMEAEHIADGRARFRSRGFRLQPEDQPSAGIFRLKAEATARGFRG